jgi:type IV secretory pathway TrbL component
MCGGIAGTAMIWGHNIENSFWISGWSATQLSKLAHAPTCHRGASVCCDAGWASSKSKIFFKSRDSFPHGSRWLSCRIVLLIVLALLVLLVLLVLLAVVLLVLVVLVVLVVHSCCVCSGLMSGIALAVIALGIAVAIA